MAGKTHRCRQRTTVDCARLTTCCATFCAALSCAKSAPPAAKESTVAPSVSAPSVPAPSVSAPSVSAAPPPTTSPRDVAAAAQATPSAGAAGVAPTTGTRQVDFSVYWRELRAALLSADPESASRWAEFPFTVRGEMDDDPVRQIERAGFADIVRRLLAQDVGLSAEPEPLSRYLQRFPSPPADAVTGTTARVASMEFDLRPEGWRFVGAYLGDSE